MLKRILYNYVSIKLFYCISAHFQMMDNILSKGDELGSSLQKEDSNQTSVSNTRPAKENGKLAVLNFQAKFIDKIYAGILQPAGTFSLGR